MAYFLLLLICNETLVQSVPSHYEAVMEGECGLRQLPGLNLDPTAYYLCDLGDIT